ncbi:MAG: hypothetical protein HGB19_01435 [Chlorobiales bacterium]|nr:hypothetical protein [Chlorobiales bacterium]
MKKLKFAFLIAIFAVPFLFWSKESSAIPSFARKYKTSCLTCHSGFPTRNAFGEAFKNNGYRWPGGEDEDKAQQEQTKLGGSGWKNLFPDAPYPTDIPGFAPLAVYVTGTMLQYKETSLDKNGAVVRQTLNWSGPFDGRLLYGGTIGENIGFFGAFEGFRTGSTTSGVRLTWAFAPGVNLTFGNQFSNLTNSTITSVLPSSNNPGIELNIAQGDEGGYNIIAGIQSSGATQSGTSVPATSKIYDIRYLRAKYKLFGAGLLSGAGGVYGNEYNGLDNQVTVGAAIFNSEKRGGAGLLTVGPGAGESTVYAVDVAGNFGNFTGSVAFGRDSDLKLSNFYADAGYFIYPWLFARVRYTNTGIGGGSYNNPTVVPSVTAFLRANVFVAGTYTAFTKKKASTGAENVDTFNLTAGLGF